MKRCAVGILSCLPAVLPTVALSEIVPQSLRYSCDRGVEVPVTYVNADDGAVVVLNIEGRQIALVAAPAGSGARYGWPSGGSSYVWLSKGAEATLYWQADGQETVLLSCVEAP